MRPVFVTVDLLLVSQDKDTLAKFSGQPLPEPVVQLGDSETCVPMLEFSSTLVASLLRH